MMDFFWFFEPAFSIFVLTALIISKGKNERLSNQTKKMKLSALLLEFIVVVLLSIDSSVSLIKRQHQRLAFRINQLEPEQPFTKLEGDEVHEGQKDAKEAETASIEDDPDTG